MCNWPTIRRASTKEGSPGTRKWKQCLNSGSMNGFSLFIEGCGCMLCYKSEFTKEAKRLENCKRDSDLLKISITLILWVPEVFSYSACGGLLRVDKKTMPQPVDTVYKKWSLITCWDKPFLFPIPCNSLSLTLLVLELVVRMESSCHSIWSFALIC